MEDPILIVNPVVSNEHLVQLPAIPSNELSTPFTSLQGLRRETERLKTFIDWPLNFIHPSQLANVGFYYLRTKDHVACIFCRGIVGAWEEGDTALSEHIKHFSHCPFVQGSYCGNVTVSESSSNSSCESEKVIQMREVGNVGTDYCHRKEDSNEGSKVQGKAINFDDLGLPQYCGPRHREYVTYESRLESFTQWPEKVKQTPHELAEAGFFSNSISDHVTCFHCGNGIRNWQSDAVSWVEHARHYPQCSFVMLKSEKTSTKEASPVIPEEGKQLKNNSIIQENTINSTECEKLEDVRLCKICLDTELEVLFLPCTHMATCSSCALTQTHCPICRTQIKHIIKPIMS